MDGPAFAVDASGLLEPGFGHFFLVGFYDRQVVVILGQSFFGKEFQAGQHGESSDFESESHELIQVVVVDAEARRVVVDQCSGRDVDNSLCFELVSKGLQTESRGVSVGANDADSMLIIGLLDEAQEALFLADEDDAGGSAPDQRLAGFAVLELERPAVFEDTGHDKVLDGGLVQLDGGALLDLVFRPAQNLVVLFEFLEEVQVERVIASDFFVKLVTRVERIDVVIPEGSEIAADRLLRTAKNQAQCLPDQGFEECRVIELFLILKESGESGRFFDVLQKRSVADNVLLNPLLLGRLEVVEVVLESFLPSHTGFLLFGLFFPT